MQVTLEMIYDEVRKVNERLELIGDIIEEILTKNVPEIEPSEEEVKEIEDSVEEMKKGNYVTLEELKGA